MDQLRNRKETVLAQYWVVGGMFYKGTDDQAPDFIEQGYWMLRPGSNAERKNGALRDQIREGDHIALKRMMGRGASTIRITALGVVTHPAGIDTKIGVNWTAYGMNRVVDGHGCFASIHGPFKIEDDWTKEVFAT